MEWPASGAKDNPLQVTHRARKVQITFYMKEIWTKVYTPDQGDR